MWNNDCFVTKYTATSGFKPRAPSLFAEFSKDGQNGFFPNRRLTLLIANDSEDILFAKSLFESITRFGHAEDENFAQYSRILFREAIDAKMKGDVLTSLRICFSLMNPTMKKKDQNDFVHQVIRMLNITDKWTTFNRIKFKVATALFTRAPFIFLENVFNSLNLSQTQDLLSSLRHIAQFGPNIICAMNHDYQILNSFDDLIVVKNSLVLFHGSVSDAKQVYRIGMNNKTEDLSVINYHLQLGAKFERQLDEHLLIVGMDMAVEFTYAQDTQFSKKRSNHGFRQIGMLIYHLFRYLTINRCFLESILLPFFTLGFYACFWLNPKNMIWDDGFMASFGAEKYILMKTYLGTNTILQITLNIYLSTRMFNKVFIDAYYFVQELQISKASTNTAILLICTFISILNSLLPASACYAIFGFAANLPDFGVYVGIFWLVQLHSTVLGLLISAGVTFVNDHLTIVFSILMLLPSLALTGVTETLGQFSEEWVDYLLQVTSTSYQYHRGILLSQWLHIDLEVFCPDNGTMSQRIVSFDDCEKLHLEATDGSDDQFYFSLIILGSHLILMFTFYCVGTLFWKKSKIKN